MIYSPVLLVHIFGGVGGVLSGSTALIARKGSPLHRKAGDVFVISMLFMAAAGAYMALIHSEPANVMGGVFTFYLVATAWLTVQRRPNETGRLEYGLLFLGLASGASAFFLAWQAAHSPTGLTTGEAIPYMVFGAAGLLAGAGDLRMMIHGGVAGSKRLIRHLWRMNIALFIAAGSFFLGEATDPVLRRTGLRAKLFTPAVRHTHLPDIPVLLIVVLTLFWLGRVWFSKAYKTSGAKLPSLRNHATNAGPLNRPELGALAGKS
jgi:hypothetical protein